LLGHSITKSVVNALAGVLVRDGKLSVTEKAPVSDWQSPDDGRKAITIENLLRMNAGFGFDEGGGASIATHMWYGEPDTADFAASAELQTAPGTRWGYSSRNFTLLSRIVGDRLKANPQAFRDFAWRELFGPLGMSSFTPEFDSAGTFMGAQASFATPRDWARFGQLYLNDGVVAGRRILPEGWVKWTTTPTLGTGYGAGFWLNNTDDVIEPWGMRWGIPGAPRDAFMARGYMGQYIVIVPSAKLVIVRFGQTHGKGAGIESVGALVSSVVEALKAP
jgi:CubicO group peptidase (beta-lactamase class C family)